MGDIKGVVWKYTLSHAQLAEPFELLLPREAVLLTVDDQHGSLVLWAVVDPDQPPERRRFLVVMTGQPFTLPAGHSLRYVGTRHLKGPSGAYVEHVFELMRDDVPERWVPA